MSISVSIHPEGFEARTDPAGKYVWIDVETSDSKVGIFLITPQLCDELIEAATAAKQLLAAAEDEAK